MAVHLYMWHRLSYRWTWIMQGTIIQPLNMHLACWYYMWRVQMLIQSMQLCTTPSFGGTWLGLRFLLYSLVLPDVFYHFHTDLLPLSVHLKYGIEFPARQGLLSVLSTRTCSIRVFLFQSFSNVSRWRASRKMWQFCTATACYVLSTIYREKGWIPRLSILCAITITWEDSQWQWSRPQRHCVWQWPVWLRQGVLR